MRCLHLHGIIVSREWNRSGLIWGGGGPNKSPEHSKKSKENGVNRMPLKESNHVSPCSAYSFTLKMEAARDSETSENSARLHSLTSQKIVVSVISSVLV
jgi:hypothetical protein